MTTPRRRKPTAAQDVPKTEAFRDEQNEPITRTPAKMIMAAQVKRPYRALTYAFPRTHRHDKRSGVFDYFRLIDAPEGKNRAYDGDWIVKLPDQTLVAMSNEEFAATFGGDQ